MDLDVEQKVARMLRRWSPWLGGVVLLWATLVAVRLRDYRLGVRALRDQKATLRVAYEDLAREMRHTDASARRLGVRLKFYESQQELQDKMIGCRVESLPPAGASIDPRVAGLMGEPTYWLLTKRFDPEQDVPGEAPEASVRLARNMEALAHRRVQTRPMSQYREFLREVVDDGEKLLEKDPEEGAFLIERDAVFFDCLVQVGLLSP